MLRARPCNSVKSQPPVPRSLRLRKNATEGEIAARNVRALILDIGEELYGTPGGELAYGWKAGVAAEIDLSQTCVGWLLTGRTRSLRRVTIERVAKKCHCPKEVLTRRAG